MPLARRRFLGALAAALTSPLVARRASAMTIDPTPNLTRELRDHVLFVVIDRPADAVLDSHAPNIRGLEEAVRAFDPRTRVTSITIADLANMDAEALDATYKPLAIIGAGSFTEWHQYGVDAEWRRALDHWMAIIRETTIPMLAICGSHQLVAAAFNGFGAIAHMADRGDPVRISEELAASTPHGMWPNPRVGEEGTYPVAPTAAGASDPLVRAMTNAPMAASHHKDMVVDTTGFSVLYQDDQSRAPATTAPDQARTRCRVQAMKRNDPRRVLYSSQFHPEMICFDESTTSDRGFGAAWVSAFLGLARSWWSERDLTIQSRSARSPAPLRG